MIHSQTKIVLLFLCIFSTNAWRPCIELSPALRFPCRCNVEIFGSSRQLGAVSIDCNGIVFTGDGPQLPHAAPIIAYSQKSSGLQALPAQALGALRLPIGMFDFSQNLVRRLSEKVFYGVKDTLVELRLADNLLGDSLNPIFSTPEFHFLSKLRILDLSGNRLKAIEEGLLKGCELLETLYLDRNNLTSVPSGSMNGPVSLKRLSLTYNNIGHLRRESFSAQKQLEIIDLSYNLIKSVEGGAFYGLKNIKKIFLRGNRLTKLNSDVFNGIPSLESLDLSENFILQFPTVALENIINLKFLNLSSNLIQKLDSNDLQFTNIRYMDFSRNSITSISPGTFRNLKSLQYLDLSLNSLRTIEDDALEGLNNLRTLIIRDNNILLIPGSALGRLSKLSTIYLDFNRIAALSSEILSSIQSDDVRHLSLSRNVIRELPTGCFKLFIKLQKLDLSGNSLAILNSDTFLGLENTLEDLNLSQNKITGVGSYPINLNKLRKLDLSYNSITDLPQNTFDGLENLFYLNMSGNMHLAPFPSELIMPLTKLLSIDLSMCGIKVINGELFSNSLNLSEIFLNNNQIQEINDATFTNLMNITTIDLSYNNITTIKTLAFVNVMSLKRLSLKGNQLNTFKGEFFNTGTGLEILDLSYNQLSYLFPSSFRIHPRLRKLIISNNKFSFFPSELIASLQFLKFIDLSNNQLKTIDELDFARLPRLHTIRIANNEIETLSEMSFHNSTQLQIIDLSYNKLDRIGERTFEGLIRLSELNLEGNLLTELSETLFDRNKIQRLENINLAYNKFDYAPLSALQKQYSHLSSVDLSHNKIKDITADDSIMVNIKSLDLSFNPLTQEAIKNILTEPKTVRELNLAGTGIKSLLSLETPFLQYLNLSNNELEDIDAVVFQRSTLLENLDLSSNKLISLESLSKAWPKLLMLKYLNLSNNSLEIIQQGEFDHLEALKELSISDLNHCTKIERYAFRYLTGLSQLNAYNLPVLGYLDIQGILESLPAIETLDIEVKDSLIGTEQIQPAKHPRLKSIGLRGERLKTISSGTLAGLKSNNLIIKLINTSLVNLPPALLFPIPRSSHLTLDISGSKVTVLTPQFLAALEDRRNNFKLKGLQMNPINCDCNARALRRWLQNTRMIDIKCSYPEYLYNKVLTEVGDDELTCDQKKFTTPKTTSHIDKSTSKTLTRSTTTTEPIIIWSIESTKTPIKTKIKSSQVKQATMNNDDTLIIGIVGGVVAFIAILIIIICIVRLKMSSSYQNGPIAPINQMGLNPNNIPISYKGASNSALYTIAPYAHSYATLPHKSLHQSQQNLSQIRPTYSTMGKLSYYQQQQQQHSNGQGYVVYPDEKSFR